MGFNKSKLGYYGLGLGLRRELRALTLDFFHSNENNSNANDKLINWLEIVPENYIFKGGKYKKQFQEVIENKIQLIPHGVNLSIGTAPEPGKKASYDKELISALKELFQEIKPPWFSDHVSCTRIDGIYLQDLIPLPFTKEAVKICADNIKFLQDEFQLPFLIENPSYYSKIIEPEMNEAEFMNSIMHAADCGMLLDVNNVYVNSVNHEYDYHKYMEELELERVAQVHIAGHLEGYQGKLSSKFLKILDTHGETIIDEVYKILDLLLSKTEINAILLERDSNFPGDFNDLIIELRKIKGVMNKHSKLEYA